MIAADSGVFERHIDNMRERVFTQDHNVTGFRGIIEIYLYSLFASLKKVTKDYIRYTYYTSDTLNEKRKKEESHVERVFAYELYRQWCDNEIIKANTRLVINAEIPKQLVDCEDDGHLYYPDLVLHLGQNASKGNLIVCEFKRKDYVDLHPDEMQSDFKKLKHYIDEGTKAKNIDNWEPFKIGVFVMVVKFLTDEEVFSIKLIEQYFNQEIRGYCDNIKKRIICVVYNGEELKYATLKDLTDKR